MRPTPVSTPFAVKVAVACLAAYAALGVVEALVKRRARGRFDPPLLGTAVRVALAALIAVLALRLTRRGFAVAQALAGTMATLHAFALFYLAAAGRGAARLMAPVADVALLATTLRHAGRERHRLTARWVLRTGWIPAAAMMR